MRNSYRKETPMWIYKDMVQERVKMPETGLTKIISVKIKGEGLKAQNEAFKRLQDKIEKIAFKRLLFSEAISLYVADISKSLKPSSVRKARISLHSIIEITGDAYLDNMTAGFVRKKFLESGRENRTLNGFLKIFKTFWLWAYRNDLVHSREVFDKLTPFADTPKKARIQDKFLETNEMNTLLDAMHEERWKLITKALLLSGLRIGEFIALDKNDVRGDFIHVTKTYDANNKVITSAKTFDSKRDVFIQKELREVLDEITKYTKWQAQVCGYETIIYFPDVDGGRLKYYAYRKYLTETAQKALNRSISPHCLRHSHCSMLALAGVPLEQISQRLGHSDSRITKEIYLHRMQELKDRENARLDALHLIG